MISTSSVVVAAKDQVSSDLDGEVVILNLKDELTEDSVDSLRQAVDRELGAREVVDVVLNMEQVPFIDSAALEYLLELQELLAERLGQVKFVAADENILKILEITRLESTFEVFADLPEAVKVLQN